jgi:hypothetical protein
MPVFTGLDFIYVISPEGGGVSKPEPLTVRVMVIMQYLVMFWGASHLADRQT